MTKKVCIKCGLEKDESDFQLRKDTGRRRNECTACRYEARRKYYAENKDQLSDYNRNWRKNHQNEIKERSKTYYSTNKTEILKKQKNYYIENKDTLINYQREYRESHAEQISDQHKKYWQNHLDERHAYQKAYQVTHADEIRERSRQKYRSDPESARQKNKENYWKHREKRLQKQRAYYDENKDWLVKNHTAWQVKKMKEDPIFKLKEQIRNLIRNSYRRTGFHKNSKTADILGCDFETLNTHLRAIWLKNYGTEWNGEDYHIDHIVPLATAKTEDEVRALCHYDNLQMLKPSDNIAKSDKLDWN